MAQAISALSCAGTRGWRAPCGLITPQPGRLPCPCLAWCPVPLPAFVRYANGCTRRSAHGSSCARMATRSSACTASARGRGHASEHSSKRAAFACTRALPNCGCTATVEPSAHRTAAVHAQHARGPQCVRGVRGGTSARMLVLRPAHTGRWICVFRGWQADTAFMDQWHAWLESASAVWQSNTQFGALLATACNSDRVFTIRRATRYMHENRVDTAHRATHALCNCSFAR